jgi:hypothetical protein
MQLHPLYEQLHHAISALPAGPGQEALRVVVDRHGPAHWQPERDWITCSECALLAWPPPDDPTAMWSDTVYPCGTVVDVARALGVAVDPVWEQIGASRIEHLLAASSLGTAEALLLRSRTSDAVAGRILERANQIHTEGPRS